VSKKNRRGAPAPSVDTSAPLNKAAATRPPRAKSRRKKTRGKLRASTPAEIAPRTEGQRLLAEQPGSVRELAKQARCSRSAVSNWRAGIKVPEPVYRARLEAAFGIPSPAWTVAPGEELPGAHDASTPAAGVASAAAGPLPTTLEHALELLRVLRTERQKSGLASAERIRLTQTEAQIVALRHRLEREDELLEDRIVREHPAWQRFKGRLMRTLLKFPDAAKAVAVELEQLEA